MPPDFDLNSKANQKILQRHVNKAARQINYPTTKAGKDPEQDKKLCKTLEKKPEFAEAAIAFFLSGVGGAHNPPKGKPKKIKYAPYTKWHGKATPCAKVKIPNTRIGLKFWGNMKEPGGVVDFTLFKWK